MPVLVVGPPHSGVDVMTTFLGALGMATLTESQQLSFDQLARETLESVGASGTVPPARADLVVASAGSRASTASFIAEAFTDRHFALGVVPGAVLAPACRRAVKGRCAVVVLVRDPDEVAHAAHVRDGLSVPLALAAWHETMRTMISGLVDESVIVVSYASFVEDPLSVGADIADALVVWGHLDPTASVHEAAATVAARKGSLTTAPSTESTKARVAPRRLFKKLLSLEGAHASFDPGKLKETPWWMTTLLDERREALARERLAEHHCQEALEATEAALTRANQERTSVLVEHGFVVGERDAAAEQRDALKAAVEALEHDYENALGDLADSRAQLVTLRERYDALQRLLAFARMRWWARFIRELRD